MEYGSHRKIQSGNASRNGGLYFRCLGILFDYSVPAACLNFNIVQVAHGEGRFAFKDNTIYKKLVKEGLVALRYVDDNGQPTEVYPLNPNGSVEGLAGTEICIYI